jgi:hypothetical protein
MEKSWKKSKFGHGILIFGHGKVMEKLWKFDG